MACKGGVKFFDKNLALFEDGARAVASSNEPVQNFILGTNRYYQWQSAGSDDGTTETITITFPQPTEISRLFILGHNLKNFNITSVPATTITNVTSIESSTPSTNIFASNIENSTSYYSFDPITVTGITITMFNTQIPDEQKKINQVVLTNEIGTLCGFPTISNVGIDRNLVKDSTITGRQIVEKGYEVASFDMRLVNYPYQDDIDILDSLHERERPFLTWLCGGIPDNFRIKQRGWRLEDLYQTQIDGDLRNGYERNVYSLGVTGRYNFQEVVR